MTRPRKAHRTSFRRPEAVEATRRCGRPHEAPYRSLISKIGRLLEEGRTQAYRALNAAELQRIDALVKQAIGFDEQRGDMISVVNAPFAPGAAMEDMPGPPFWENPRVVELARAR